MILELLLGKIQIPESQEKMITVRFTPNELKIMSYLVARAKDEFSNHGCNDLNVTREIGLPASAAQELHETMIAEGVIDPECIYREGSALLHDTWVLSLLEKRLSEVTPTPASKLSPTDPDKVLLAPFEEANLVAKIKQKSPIIIIGGKSVTTEGGFAVYEDGFKIWEGTSDGKSMSTGNFFGKRNAFGSNKSSFKSLEIAIQFVIGNYQVRRGVTCCNFIGCTIGSVK